MKIMLKTLLIGGVAVAGAASTTLAESMDGHTVLPAEKVEWGPGPASLPPGAEAVVLHGDPSGEGLFALRLRLPEDYTIPPHTHPQPEIVTVLSGTFHFGMGETADRAEAEPLPAGSFFAMPPGEAHYAFTDEETVIQLNSTGPWELDYVDPADDPRQRSQ